jgi:hypothetical protein
LVGKVNLYSRQKRLKREDKIYATQPVAGPGKMYRLTYELRGTKLDKVCLVQGKKWCTKWT